MINILPNNDLKEHTEDSLCECNPNVIFENGEMMVIHNSYDGREWTELLTENQIEKLNAPSNSLNETINENTEMFIEGVESGKLSIKDLKELLILSEKEDEFEVSISLRNAIKKFTV